MKKKELLVLPQFSVLQDEIIEEEYGDKDWDHITQEEYYHIDELATERLEILLNEAKNLLEDADEFYLIDGSAGLWNGDKPYQVQKVGDWDTLFNKVVDRKDDVEFKIYKRHKGFEIEAKGIHHDGVNNYKFVTLDALTKDELYNIFGNECELRRHHTRADMEDLIESYYYG